MARCCGSVGTCACKVEGGRGVTITGTGTAQDPFVIASDRALDVEDTPTFNLVLTGNGTLQSPWLLHVEYAPTAQLTDLPDVDAPAPTNGQVLTWDEGLAQWVPAAAVTAPPGAVTTDTSLDGDGSVDAPLGVVADDARYLIVTADGVGLTDTGINRLVRPYADAASRAADPIAPLPNAISILDNVPGRLDYWNEETSEWRPISNGIGLDVTGEFLQLSGPYNAGPVTTRLEQISATTDANGEFEVLSAADLSTYAGVLTVHLQPVGTVPWIPLVRAEADRVVGKAYRLDDGTPYVGFILNATLTAMLY